MGALRGEVVDYGGEPLVHFPVQRIQLRPAVGAGGGVQLARRPVVGGMCRVEGCQQPLHGASPRRPLPLHLLQGKPEIALQRNDRRPAGEQEQKGQQKEE
ncbi:hypothetical protein [Lewinella sp. IMCC34191]|uniref:hypothetical protein n=1 Tax=Lewinella sp. IMCC34191 TaxID=2259172 RepID=UPI001300AFA8|nr:hypothetical protein [Lewinella sp. IMCC34191]